VEHLNPSARSTAPAWARGCDAQAAHPRDLVGVGAHAEGRGTSGAAAGLVLFKTSPDEPQQVPASQRENGQISIDLNKPARRLKRLKGLKKSVWLAGQLHAMHKPGYRPPVPWLVTATYAKENAWQPHHMSEATDRFRHWCKVRGVECRYTWVAELTKAGRVHYHLVAWLPQGVRMPQWDRARRVKGKLPRPFWGHGMTKTEVLNRGVAYLMKYLSKMGEFHEFPDGLRLHGSGGMTPEARAIRSWQNLPQWVKNDHGVGEVKRMHGGLVDLSTGELLPPMYSRKFRPGAIDLCQLRPMPPKLYDHGAFCSFPRP